MLNSVCHVLYASLDLELTIVKLMPLMMVITRTEIANVIRMIGAVLSSVCIGWMEQLSILHGLRPREIPFRFLYILFTTTINITTTTTTTDQA